MEIAEERGWSAIGIRAAGRRVGKTGTAINRVFTETTLREALVRRAFAAILVAVPADRQDHLDRSGACALLAAHVWRERLDVALMVQVAAQINLAGTDEAPLAAYIRESRQKTIGLLASEEPSLVGIKDRKRRVTEAQGLVDGYMAACLAQVVEPRISAERVQAVMMR